MRPKAEIIEDLMQLHADGKLVHFAVPGSELVLGVERSQLEQAMDLFYNMSRERRGSSFASIKDTIKEGVSKFEAGTAADNEMDALASDCILYLAHEMIYSDGEKLLVKPPKNIDYESH